MGNISPRQSRSYHDGFANHLTLTPTRSSWKKQLQLINETFNIKKISLRPSHGKMKRSGTISTENTRHSSSTQNFHELIKKNPGTGTEKKKPSKSDPQPGNVKKSFSLFSIKQPLADLTNKEPAVRSVGETDQPSVNSTSNALVQHRRRSRVDLTTVHKRHTTFIPSTYYLPKSQSQYYHIQLSSHGVPMGSNSSSFSTSSTRKTIIQASTSELLRCLSEYLCSSCSHLSPKLELIDCITWIKSADRHLILQGWQEQVFVNPANLVFVYLILRETLTYVVPSAAIQSVRELHSIVLTCLYLAFSYMGHEITYPLKPFVTEHETRTMFWQRVVLIMRRLSSKMLAINRNPKFFTECFSELKKFNLV